MGDAGIQYGCEKGLQCNRKERKQKERLQLSTKIKDENMLQLDSSTIIQIGRKGVVRYAIAWFR